MLYTSLITYLCNLTFNIISLILEVINIRQGAKSTKTIYIYLFLIKLVLLSVMKNEIYLCFDGMDNTYEGHMTYLQGVQETHV